MIEMSLEILVLVIVLAVLLGALGICVLAGRIGKNRHTNRV
jgi:hypothetical protein